MSEYIELAKKCGATEDFLGGKPAHSANRTYLFTMHELTAYSEALRAKDKAYIDSLQAKIDRLMLEFCPNEMTPEQIVAWGNSQIPVDTKTQALIERATKGELK